MTAFYIPIDQELLKASSVQFASINAKLRPSAGSTVANSAPLKLASGALNTTAEAGAIEFLNDDFYGTITTGATRRKFLQENGTYTLGGLTIGAYDIGTVAGASHARGHGLLSATDHTDIASYLNQALLTTSDVTHKSLKLSDLTAGRVPFSTTNGLLTDSANLTYDGTGITLTGNASSDLPTVGDELLTSAGWTLGLGWSGDFASGFTHGASSGTATLTHNLGAVNGDKYLVTLTVTNRTAGSFTFAFGGDSTVSISASRSISLMASNTDAITITPLTSFNGTIVISMKKLTGDVTSLLTLKDSAGNIRNEFRANNLASTMFIGVGAGRSGLAPADTVGIGYLALSSLMTSDGNTALGSQAGRYVVKGTNNVFLGRLAGRDSSGSYSVWVGAYAGYMTTAGNNTGVGYNAGRTITTGTGNLLLGYGAGFHASQLATATNSIAIGNGTYTTANNQVIIGDATVSVGLAQTAPTARLHLPAGQAGANLAPLKIDPGVLNTTAVSGCIESDGTHLYWTDSSGSRKQLDN